MNPIQIIQAELQQHRLTQQPVRRVVAEHYQESARDDWPEVSCYLSGDSGALRLYTPKPHLHHTMLDMNADLKRYKGREPGFLWAQIKNGAIGEIGFAATDDGERHTVWRTAFGNPTAGAESADDSQPWRWASSVKHAYGLLMESLLNSLTNGRSFGEIILAQRKTDFTRHYDGKAEGTARRDNYSAALRFVGTAQKRPDMISELLVGPNVEVYPAASMERPFYDPRQGAFVPAQAMMIGRRWHGMLLSSSKEDAWTSERGHIRCVELDESPYNGVYAERMAQDGCAVLYRHQACEVAMMFGDRMPAYVREAMIATRGLARFLPLKGKHGAEYRDTLDHVIRGTADWKDKSAMTTMHPRVLKYRTVEAPSGFQCNDNLVASEWPDVHEACVYS